MTGSVGPGPDVPTGGPDGGHRVRRRRRAASRPAGPPTAREDRDAEPAPGSDPVPAPSPDPARPAELPAAVDPVEKSDRRREKKRRNRAERLAAEAAAKPASARASAEPAARGRRASGDRGLHGLEGNRSTQLPFVEAVRAREWAAPGPADLAAAEAEVVIVRRHYRPPEPLPTKGQTSGQDGRGERRSAADRRRRD